MEKGESQTWQVYRRVSTNYIVIYNFGFEKKYYGKLNVGYVRGRLGIASVGYAYYEEKE